MDGCKKRAVVCGFCSLQFFARHIAYNLLAHIFEMDWEEATSEEESEVLEKNNIHSSTVECLRGELAHAYTTT